MWAEILVMRLRYETLLCDNIIQPINIIVVYLMWKNKWITINWYQYSFFSYDNITVFYKSLSIYEDKRETEDPLKLIT